MLLTATLVLPLLVMLALVPQNRQITAFGTAAACIAGMFLLMATSLCYLVWRISKDPAWGWLVAAAVLSATQTLSCSAVAMMLSIPEVGPNAWMLACDLGTGLVVLGLVLHSRTAMRCADPLITGLALGLVFTTFHLLAAWQMAHDTPMWLLGVLRLLVGATYVAAGVLVLRHPGLPRGTAPKMVGALMVLALGHLASMAIGAQVRMPELVTTVVMLVGAVAFSSLSATLLRHTLDDQDTIIEGLRAEVDAMALNERTNRERMHEVRSTLAGIGEASYLMRLHGRGVVDAGQRRRFERMMESEIARLIRLMDPDDPPEPSPVDLDAALDPLLEAHRMRGRDVSWKPTGHTFHGRSDDIAEAVNILLENTARHGGGGRSSVTVTHRDDILEIEVSDSGPGIPPEFRKSIFEWGVSGRGSTGQGIGLALARRLVSDQGGTLDLLSDAGPGASFLITLPSPRHAEETDDAVATA